MKRWCAFSASAGARVCEPQSVAERPSKVAVGFQPTVVDIPGCLRRGATVEPCQSSLGGPWLDWLQASLRDAGRSGTCFPWVKTHDYHRDVAARRRFRSACAMRFLGPRRTTARVYA